ncbi:MAG: SIMPL domain-containing protein [Flavisolibacter sp.]
MSKLILASLFVVITTNLFAQSQTSDEIVAEGNAKTKLKPDLVRFTLTVSKSNTVEKEAIHNLNKTVEGLVSSFSSLGFSNDNIKIASYEVSSFTDRDHKKKYTATNVLTINFRIDNRLINQFYGEIEQSGIEDVEINYETSLSDSLEKASRVRLVQQAISDAKAYAMNIAQTLNLQIKKVKQVQKYGWMGDVSRVEMVKFTPPIITSDRKVNENTPFEEFEVAEVELEEKITIVFEIGN